MKKIDDINRNSLVFKKFQRGDKMKKIPSQISNHEVEHYMNKFLIFCIIFNCVLFSTVLANELDTFEPLSNTYTSISSTYNPLSGIIQWICYAIVCFLIIFAIIKFIKMLKNKKPIWKCILFILVIFGITFLLMYLAFLLPLLLKF